MKIVYILVLLSIINLLQGRKLHKRSTITTNEVSKEAINKFSQNFKEYTLLNNGEASSQKDVLEKFKEVWRQFSDLKSKLTLEDLNDVNIQVVPFLMEYLITLKGTVEVRKEYEEGISLYDILSTKKNYPTAEQQQQIANEKLKLNISKLLEFADVLEENFKVETVVFNNKRLSKLMQAIITIGSALDELLKNIKVDYTLMHAYYKFGDVYIKTEDDVKYVLPKYLTRFSLIPYSSDFVEKEFYFPIIDPLSRRDFIFNKAYQILGENKAFTDIFEVLNMKEDGTIETAYLNSKDSIVFFEDNETGEFLLFYYDSTKNQWNNNPELPTWNTKANVNGYIISPNFSFKLSTKVNEETMENFFKKYESLFTKPKPK